MVILICINSSHRFNMLAWAMRLAASPTLCMLTDTTSTPCLIFTSQVFIITHLPCLSLPLDVCPYRVVLIIHQFLPWWGQVFCLIAPQVIHNILHGGLQKLGPVGPLREWDAGIWKIMVEGHKHGWYAQSTGDICNYSPHTVLTRVR